MAKQNDSVSGVVAIQDQLDAVNRERADYEAEHRARAIELRRQRDAAYIAATAKRDGIATGAIDNRTGKVVQVYDPDLLDAETLETLAHMGTPVPPLDEVYPDGVTMSRGR